LAGGLLVEALPIVMTTLVFLTGRPLCALHVFAQVHSAGELRGRAGRRSMNTRTGKFFQITDNCITLETEPDQAS